MNNKNEIFIKIIMSLLIPKDSKMVGSELINILLKDDDTIIENIIDSSRFSIIIIFSISKNLSIKLGLKKLDERNIRDIERPYVTKFILKLVFLGTGNLGYRSYNQKLEKFTSTIKSFKKEIKIQKDIFQKSILTGRIITPQILYNKIYYEYNNGKFQNEINIFNVLSKIKQKHQAYLKFYNYYIKKLEIFKGYVKPTFFRWTTFTGLGLMLMTYNENYIPLSKLNIPNKLKLKEIVTKQFYMLKEYGYVHNDTHAGNYLWDYKKNYGLIIDFGESYYDKNVKDLDLEFYIFKAVGKDVLDATEKLVTDKYDEFIKTKISEKDLIKILNPDKLYE